VKRGHGSKWGRKMETAVAALLTQRTVEDAARTAGISVSTLLRWQKIPEFGEAYREARRAAISQSNARLQQASSAAVSVVLKMMLDPNIPPACRLRAAETVLSHGVHGMEREDIEVRVAALEAATPTLNSSKELRGELG
jgi:hypothetical protein